MVIPHIHTEMGLGSREDWRPSSMRPPGNFCMTVSGSVDGCYGWSVMLWRLFCLVCSATAPRMHTRPLSCFRKKRASQMHLAMEWQGYLYPHQRGSNPDAGFRKWPTLAYNVQRAQMCLSWRIYEFHKRSVLLIRIRATLLLLRALGLSDRKDM